jgi:hypothetical protein
MFHVSDGVFFRRNSDGSVAIFETTDGKEPGADNIRFTHEILAGPWVSVVLTMSQFNERPGDWHAWMKHHMGEEDLLAGKRGGY